MRPDVMSDNGGEEKTSFFCFTGSDIRRTLVADAGIGFGIGGGIFERPNCFQAPGIISYK